jgi:ribosomal protein L23
MRIFLRLAQRWFGFTDIYCPNDQVEAIIFAVDMKQHRDAIKSAAKFLYEVKQEGSAVGV